MSISIRLIIFNRRGPWSLGTRSSQPLGTEKNGFDGPESFEEADGSLDTATYSTVLTP